MKGKMYAAEILDQKSWEKLVDVRPSEKSTT